MEEPEEKSVKIHSDEFELEGRLYQPVNSIIKQIGIIVTHPMPMLGGSMHNNVVIAICRHFGRMGFTTLRFNFRGVGKSKGAGSWFGSGERKDVINTCNFLTAKGIEQIFLVGYSYGSVISCSVADEIRAVRAFAGISYPFGPLSLMLLGHLLEKANSTKPKFFIMGDNDNFTSISKFNRRLEALPDPKEQVILRGADHFYAGYEEELCQALQCWIEKLPYDIVDDE
mmetsp:Transcript_8168/g.9058  ORF Transcript_8168/g.9058 Transcript_8168/m.9058 type:complete len:227 (-) Transcript_8168:154-834(-)